MGEWQIYADGFPQEVRLQSGVIDLGRQISALQWSAETPAGTAIAIRSRTGNELARSVAIVY